MLEPTARAVAAGALKDLQKNNMRATATVVTCEVKFQCRQVNSLRVLTTSCTVGRGASRCVVLPVITFEAGVEGDAPLVPEQCGDGSDDVVHVFTSPKRRVRARQFLRCAMPCSMRMRREECALRCCS
jgi:hypothetical protein